MRLLREPDRALPEEDRGGRGGQREPGHRARNHPVPAQRDGTGGAGRRDRGGRVRGPRRSRRTGGRADLGGGAGRRAHRGGPRAGEGASGARDPVAGEPGRRGHDHAADVLARPALGHGGPQQARPLARHLHPVLGRCAVLPRRVARAPARQLDHGHAGRRGHERGLGLQRLRHDVPRRGAAGRDPPGHLLRQLHHHRGADPAGTLAGGARQGPDRGRRQGADRAPGEVRARGSR